MTKLDASRENSLKSTNDSKQDNSDTPNQKKKRKKRSTICTTYCKFDIVRKTARNLGMKEVPYTDAWNVLWTDYSVSISKIKALKGYQRVNHFPGMAEICHKALLAKNLNRMAKIFPKQYNFFPKSWCFPSEYNDAVDYSKKHAGKTYILKPGAGCRGQGIQLTKNFRCLPPADKLICQLYISKPFLVDGLKFDLRIYTLVTSCDPLKIFVYNEGLARFATAPYRKPAGYNLSNCYMHLTNYSVNKYSSTFISDGECGTKRRLSCLNQWLSRNLYDVDEIWAKIDDVIIKTIISALPIIKHSYQVSFPNHNTMPACFEILGFDILLDSSLNPYVLEVNHSPSFNTDSKVDEEIKLALLEDTFRLLNLAEMDTQKILDQDKRKAQMRLQNGLDFQGPDDDVVLSNLDLIWEEGDMGNYRLVYPVKSKTQGGAEDPYYDFLNHTSNMNIMVADNAVSKVREQVSKIQRSQLSQKDQLEQLMKVHNVNINNQLQMHKIPETNTKPEASKLKVHKDNVNKTKVASNLNTLRTIPSVANEKVAIEKVESKIEKKIENKIENKTENKIEIKDEKEKHDKTVKTKGDLKQDILNKHLNDMRSDINLVLLETESQTKIRNESHQGSEYFVKKLYKRLNESGHMPGAFYPIVKEEKSSTPDIIKLAQLSDTKTSANKKTEKSLVNITNSNTYVEVKNIIEDAKQAPKREERTHKKRMQLKEYTLRFHSRAASEFLKFQKMKLLRKFQDLT